MQYKSFTRDTSCKTRRVALLLSTLTANTEFQGNLLHLSPPTPLRLWLTRVHLVKNLSLLHLTLCVSLPLFPPFFLSLMHLRTCATASSEVGVKELTGTVKCARKRERERGGVDSICECYALSFIELLWMRPQRSEELRVDADMIVAFN